MPPKVNTWITWTIQELNELIKKENSCVFKETLQRHVSLHPIHLNDTKKALKDILNSSINTFDTEFNGLLIAYKNPKLLCPLGFINYDNYFIHMNVQADFYIFRPAVGSVLTGVVNKKEENYIGVLVHKAFNVSITKRMKDDSWQGHYLEVGQEATFTVTQVDLRARVPFIRGKLLIEDTVDGNNEEIDGDEDIDENVENNLNEEVEENEHDAGHHEAEESQVESSKSKAYPSFLGAFDSSDSEDERVRKAKKKGKKRKKNDDDDEISQADDSGMQELPDQFASDVSQKRKHDDQNDSYESKNKSKRLKVNKSVEEEDKEEEEEEVEDADEGSDEIPPSQLSVSPVGSSVINHDESSISSSDNKPRIIHDEVLLGKSLNFKVDKNIEKKSKQKKLPAHNMSESDEDRLSQSQSQSSKFDSHEEQEKDLPAPVKTSKSIPHDILMKHVDETIDEVIKNSLLFESPDPEEESDLFSSNEKINSKENKVKSKKTKKPEPLGNSTVIERRSDSSAEDTSQIQEPISPVKKTKKSKPKEFAEPQVPSSQSSNKQVILSNESDSSLATQIKTKKPKKSKKSKDRDAEINSSVSNSLHDEESELHPSIIKIKQEPKEKKSDRYNGIVEPEPVGTPMVNGSQLDSSGDSSQTHESAAKTKKSKKSSKKRVEEENHKERDAPADVEQNTIEESANIPKNSMIIGNYSDSDDDLPNQSRFSSPVKVEKNIVQKHVDETINEVVKKSKKSKKSKDSQVNDESNSLLEDYSDLLPRVSVKQEPKGKKSDKNNKVVEPEPVETPMVNGSQPDSSEDPSRMDESATNSAETKTKKSKKSSKKRVEEQDRPAEVGQSFVENPAIRKTANIPKNSMIVGDYSDSDDDLPNRSRFLSPVKVEKNIVQKHVDETISEVVKKPKKSKKSKDSQVNDELNSSVEDYSNLLPRVSIKQEPKGKKSDKNNKVVEPEPVETPMVNGSQPDSSDSSQTHEPAPKSAEAKVKKSKKSNKKRVEENEEQDRPADVEQRTVEKSANIHKNSIIIGDYSDSDDDLPNQSRLFASVKVEKNTVGKHTEETINEVATKPKKSKKSKDKDSHSAVNSSVDESEFNSINDSEIAADTSRIKQESKKKKAKKISNGIENPIGNSTINESQLDSFIDADESVLNSSCEQETLLHSSVARIKEEPKGKKTKSKTIVEADPLGNSTINESQLDSSRVQEPVVSPVDIGAKKSTDREFVKPQVPSSSKSSHKGSTSEENDSSTGKKNKTKKSSFFVDLKIKEEPASDVEGSSKKSKSKHKDMNKEQETVKTNNVSSKMNVKEEVIVKQEDKKSGKRKRKDTHNLSNVKDEAASDVEGPAAKKKIKLIFTE
ncbi:probable serine/threonine-protein kinase kinX [Microplitis mediator]|uniref:probable serine/threonine-protein kinase kinX n=1 Tax=Microplitis mediator TaxID=375433 RepID=UPI0025538DFE|nr:probable serine/threonine-protein kinase kinX [Microplitis mediator]